MADNPAQYFREYRRQLGFSSQGSAKDFLAGKDISPPIDYDYILELNRRIRGIIEKLNQVIHPSARIPDVVSFCTEQVDGKYEIIREANILPRLNNQGRRPEEVLFSWLRGHALAEYFIPSLAKIFHVSLTSISLIGDDDLRNVETFKRSPKADLAITVRERRIRVEVQTGYQGINDIKAHKVYEAHRIFDDQREPTVCIHFDIFNGQTAFVRLDTIANNDMNWVTRQQMEGQTVFSIDQNFFKWRLLDPIPGLETLELEL